MNTTTTEANTTAAHPLPFTATELDLLRRLYAGVSIRALRQQYQLEPWDILRRHHNLPREQYQAVRRQLGLGACVVRAPDCGVSGGERTA